MTAPPTVEVGIDETPPDPIRRFVELDSTPGAASGSLFLIADSTGSELLSERRDAELRPLATAVAVVSGHFFVVLALP